MEHFYISCSIVNCFKHGSGECKQCANNHSRNKTIDGFKPCDDSDFSTLRALNGRYKAKQVGSAEHGGVQCPACHCLNNSYTFDEVNNNECEECGLPLTLYNS